MSSNPEVEKPFIEKEEKERDSWGSDYEFLLSCLGVAAGFGSIWKFPYLVWKNGGGVFMIPYFLFLFTFAIPIYFLELAIGQSYRRGLPDIFASFHYRLKGLGFAAIFTNFNVSIYYNLILAFSYSFLFASFTSPLPWSNEAYSNNSSSKQPLGNETLNVTNSTINASSHLNRDYFYKTLLRQEGNDPYAFGGFNWEIYGFYVLSAAIIFFCVVKGIRTSGKVALVTASAPFIMIILLLLRSLFLNGALEGFVYLFKPELRKLLDISIWVEALNMVFFQFAIGFGINTLLASFRPRSSEILGATYKF